MLPLLAASAAAAAAPRAAPDFGPGFQPSSQPNMNGDFVLSQTPGADMSKYPKAYKDYPGGAESFDVYSPPITTLYSQVWWSPLAPAPFPDDIVKKYAGKGMAIVGWEIDQVRKGAGPNGEDVSVPISASYNHHYGVNMIGASARFKKVMLEGPDDPRAKEFLAQSGHGMIPYDQPHYAVEQVAPSASGHPVKVAATSSNGGEYRKSFHGFPPGYALVVDSPTAMQVTPMQIDTWHREKMNISANTNVKFVPGPVPASSLAPREGPDAIYSGLLECPMTTRISKSVDGTYSVQTEGGCQEHVLTFQECFHAAASTLAAPGRTFVNATGSDASRPAGCSATTDPAKPLEVSVYFNRESTGSVGCGAGAQVVASAADGLVEVAVSLDAAKDEATLTLSGPSAVWFGAGFGASSMGQQPWTVVVDGTGIVTERKLGQHLAGTELKPSVKVVSSTVSNGRRTVVLSRPLKGATADYYTFATTAKDATVQFISAVGSGAKFAYHKNKAISSLAFLPVGKSGACVCPEKPKAFGQASGKLVYHAVANQSVDVGAGAVGFAAGKCAPYPATTMIPGQNPTCDIRHYRGGQWACHHMWSLLDAEQDIPWPDQKLVFHHKYRFWVQPFTEGYHTPVHYGSGSQLLIGSPWEYDVPKCAEGMAGCSRRSDGTWIHTVTGSKYNNEEMVTLNFHCHAPTCLDMSVYACPMGMSLDACGNATSAEEAEARGYKLLCKQEPVYGGSGNPHVAGTRFDETGCECSNGRAQPSHHACVV